MIRHIVMWDVRGDDAAQRAAAARQVKLAFETLRGVIPGMSALEVGIDFSDEPHACDVVLVSDFADRESLERYAGHPEHLRVRMELEGVRVNRHQVDYVME